MYIKHFKNVNVLKKCPAWSIQYLFEGRAPSVFSFQNAKIDFTENSQFFTPWIFVHTSRISHSTDM